MIRLAGLTATLAFAAMAAPPQDAVDFLGSLTEALSNNDSAAFLEGFDPAMPAYDELRQRVEAMLGEAEVAATIEIRNDETKSGTIDLDVEWSLQLTSRSAGDLRETRGMPVRLRLERKGKKWKVTSLDPVTIFGPIRTRR